MNTDTEKASSRYDALCEDVLGSFHCPTTGTEIHTSLRLAHVVGVLGRAKFERRNAPPSVAISPPPQPPASVTAPPSVAIPDPLAAAESQSAPPPKTTTIEPSDVEQRPAQNECAIDAVARDETDEFIVDGSDYVSSDDTKNDAESDDRDEVITNPAVESLMELDQVHLRADIPKRDATVDIPKPDDSDVICHKRRHSGSYSPCSSRSSSSWSSSPGATSSSSSSSSTPPLSRYDYTSPRLGISPSESRRRRKHSHSHHHHSSRNSSAGQTLSPRQQPLPQPPLPQVPTIIPTACPSSLLPVPEIENKAVAHPLPAAVLAVPHKRQKKMTTKMIGDEPKSSAKTATRKNERYPMVRKLFREMYSFAALYQLVKCDRVAVGCEKPFKEAAIVFTKAAKSNPELDTLLRTFATCKDRLAASLAAEVERYAREDRQAQPQQLQQQQQEHPGATTRACPRGVLYALLEQARSAKRIEFHTLDVMDGGDCMTVQMADGTTASLDEAVLVTVGEEKREEKRARRNVASMFVPRVIAKMMHYAYLLPKLDTIAFDDKVVKEWTAASLPAYAQGNVFPGTFLSDNKKAVDKLWGRWKRAFLFLRKNVPKW